MRTYETIFILKSELTTEEQEKHIEFYKENITSHGGEIVKMEVWGKQALAYPIEKSTEGFYVLIQFLWILDWHVIYIYVDCCR